MRLLFAGHPRPTEGRVAWIGRGAPPSGCDVELSGRIGNATPRQFRAETATGCAIRFAAARQQVVAAMTDVLDVDALLAAFVLGDPELALGHRRTLGQAAEMASQHRYGDPPAQELFQGLALVLAEPVDAAVLVAPGLERAAALLVPAVRPELAPGLKAFRRSVSLIERGEVRRTAFGARFVAYEIPSQFAPPAASYVPALGEPFSDRCVLWPQARARLDRERVTLVSAAAPGGWTHDLWYPAYCWQEALQSWRPPGLEESGAIRSAPLSAALLRLDALETGEGRWRHAERLAHGEGLRGFPVAAGFVGASGAAASSTIRPAQVAQVFAGVFA